MKPLKNLLFGKAILSSFFRVTLILTLITLPFYYHYRIVYVDGISMTPTYDDGQWTVMQRGRSFDDDWIPSRFDVVVVWSDEHEVKLCKRVIGLPGESVEVIQGQIYINGDRILDSFSKGNMVRHHLIDPTTDETWWKEYENISSRVIAPGHVWIIGDYREDSAFGHFPIKEIRGKIVLY
jgi:signal peptidase I